MRRVRLLIPSEVGNRNNDKKFHDRNLLTISLIDVNKQTQCAFVNCLFCCTTHTCIRVLAWGSWRRGGGGRSGWADGMGNKKAAERCEEDEGFSRRGLVRCSGGCEGGWLE